MRPVRGDAEVVGDEVGSARPEYAFRGSLAERFSSRLSDRLGTEPRLHRCAFVGTRKQIERECARGDVSEYFRRGGRNPITYVNC